MSAKNAGIKNWLPIKQNVLFYSRLVYSDKNLFTERKLFSYETVCKSFVVVLR